MTNYTIALLTGGPTLEVEGTISSTHALLEHFETTSHRVHVVDLDHNDDPLELIRNCDVIFNAVHGRGGEDGALHYLAELANVPITGPVWWAHSLGADKAVFKAWASEFVRVPNNATQTERYPHGLIRKPRFGGGSIGLERMVDVPEAYADTTIVEEFIPGRVVTNCVFPILATSLPLLEIRPGAHGFYDQVTKRGVPDESSYRTVNPSDTPWAQSVDDCATLLYSHLGGRGPIRFDWIVEHETDDPVLLEMNTNPGWRPLGNMGRITSAAGFSYTQLIDATLDEAVAKGAST